MEKSLFDDSTLHAEVKSCSSTQSALIENFRQQRVDITNKNSIRFDKEAEEHYLSSQVAGTRSVLGSFLAAVAPAPKINVINTRISPSRNSE